MILFSQWKPYVNQDTDYTKWTVLREGDGGRHVHELQVALVQQGFWPGEDDMQWWQFGDATCSAVQTFQVCCPVTHSQYEAIVQVLCRMYVVLVPSSPGIGCLVKVSRARC